MSRDQNCFAKSNLYSAAIKDECLQKNLFQFWWLSKLNQLTFTLQINFLRCEIIEYDVKLQTSRSLSSPVHLHFSLNAHSVISESTSRCTALSSKTWLDQVLSTGHLKYQLPLFTFQIGRVIFNKFALEC